jgi:DNA-directed RNA polymerase subunit E'
MMFWKNVVRDTIGIEPKDFGKEQGEMVLANLRKIYEGSFDEDLGLILVVDNAKVEGEGKIVLGDPRAYYDVYFDAYSFKPELQEVVYGEIGEATEFGAFVKLGAIEALIHVSQLMDDFIQADPANKAFKGKESGERFTIGDTIRARVISISMKEGLDKAKIGLTMRQPNLGKIKIKKKVE